MANSARGSHVSPGVYMNEDELLYSSNSLGITTLGLAGETQKGPAFQPMAIDTWKNFVSTFGGTSPEKFKGSQYPKYELPYIAKSYLSQSDQLEVVRVLGLSGYNAGPAWVVTASKGNENGNKYVVAVLRSRGHYEKYRKTGISESTCECQTSDNDALVYEVGERKLNANNCQKHRQYNENALTIGKYNPLYAAGGCETLDFSAQTGTYSISSTNLGRFKLQGITGAHESGDSHSNSAISETDKFDYAVSLNPNDKDYILDVLGTSPTDGDAPIYVESLYDVALEQLIASGEVDKIDSDLIFYQVFNAADFCGLEPVAGIISIPEENLTRRYLGQRYLADKAASAGTDTRLSGITCHHFDAKTGKLATGDNVGTVIVGQIYTVDQYVDSGGTRHYCYRDYTEDSISGVVSALSVNISATTKIQLEDRLNYCGDSSGITSATSTNLKTVCVKNLSDGLYYRLTKDKGDVKFIDCNLNDYKSAYRYASTPWIVSNLMGDYNHVEMKKLFRFHTISDGNNANNEVKVSIENIRPDEGVFDVVVRDINDTDEYQMPLEKYSRCSLVSGSKNYIAYKIGSFDGSYEAKSKYITVECKESDIIANSVPAGFLGYPAVQFAGTPVVDIAQSGITNPPLQYNTEYDVDTKNRKQYFGLSTRTGVDIDAFTFKGTAAYINSPKVLTHGFHLDSRLNASGSTITVDGESGYKFDAVSQNNRTSNLTDIPVIGSEEAMANTIYSYVNLRKFTVYFYGGFDGWDEFRDQRTNTDNFKASKYLGTYNSNSGEGYAFNRIDDPEAIGLNQNGITSDWYAYLAAYRQFANPESVDINIFATPGIDYVNNKLLVDEVVEMIEEERGDSIYVVTTPDKPSGAGDYADEMYTPDDAVYNLEDSELASNYTCTYYPWVKYLDTDNNQYIYLPATKDAVRNFAQTDNITYPWFAPAGLSRGDVDCVRAHYVTKIADEDTLYEGRINPVKTFATDGVKLWGQKTLYNNDDSQLSRIAVRRLMLRMKKLISTACRSLIFEPNDSVSKNTFLSTVTPILDNIRSNRGISDYKVMVDDSTDASDRRELSVQIFFKPYAALEYISLNFVITPEQISFDDL